ncbi:trimeric intracellular cation channel family protein [Sneathiella chinensis]|uniref:Membrane protein n=1 Tax=Sneathiella chinensis TaxID=349750 RepID=A0ABQ5U3H6_9PROT|nr:trimeric intracellular cation channel family protein [Sneathiella chinensis]GLQ05961.1 membrane protein [Sneathiella chinensis]
MLDSLIGFLDLLGVAVFAATGSLVASRKEMDIIGFGLMATFTGIGGGTLRDVILDRPVFWMTDPLYLVVCLTVAVLVFVFAHRIQKRFIWLLWGDAIGLVAFSVMGAEIALKSGAGPLQAVTLGIITATFGGLARDLVAGEVPLPLRQEIYVTAALLGGGLYVSLAALGYPKVYIALISIAAGFALRGGAIAFGWVLPRYKNRAGRPY